MNYLSIAESIFHWLAQYQIKQRQIVANRKGNEISFILEHPVEGKKEVIQPLPEEKYFRTHGIGLKVIQNKDEQVILKVYDYGGIFDPIAYKVPGDHYATTHFALLGAILYRESMDPEILEKVKKAIEFHLSTSKDEYCFDDWGYHWDFKNYAFLETFRLLKDDLSEEEKVHWIRGLKSLRENKKNSLTNWVAMRAYSALLRYRLFKIPFDMFKFWRRVLVINKVRQSDGCYDDSPNQSRPIQYHVFTLALLHRIFSLHPESKTRENFLSGVNYFIRFIDPDGCFNYIGRGQEQIFGYAVGVYVLEAAKDLDEENTDIYQYNLDKIWNYLLGFQRDEHFPIVLNNRRDEEKFGWYDYHYLTVYNAFLGVWIGFSHLLRKESRLNAYYTNDYTYFEFFKSTGNIVVSKDEYFIVLSGGTEEYLSEPTITPVHIWFKDIGWVFSCPGGPSRERYGKINLVENIEKNFFAPIARKGDAGWILPAYKECHRINANSELVSMVLDYGPFILNRLVLFREKTIVFEDTFEFTKKEIIDELRYFNFPVVVDKFTISLDKLNEVRLFSRNGIVQMVLIDTNFASRDFEILEKIKTVKGLASVVSLREFNFEPGEQKKYIKFSLNKFSLPK